MGDLSVYLDVAVRAAKDSGRIQRSHVDGELHIDTKSGETDLVTHVDRLCEKAIRQIIAKDFPDHGVLGEEEGASAATRDSPFRWIVDPIDGTSNFAHGLPFYCTSIALEADGDVVVGVVYDAVRDELFTAVEGRGAFLDGQRIRVTGEDVLKRSLLLTGFGSGEGETEFNFGTFARMLPRVRTVRIAGTAALSLCYVAAGRADAFWELALKPWDVAAGMLLVREAGGEISRADGSGYTLGDGSLVASNGALHALLVEALTMDPS